MSIGGTLFALAALLCVAGLVIGLIWLIVSLIAKKRKKPPLLVCLCSVVLFFVFTGVGMTLFPTDDVKDNDAEIDNGTLHETEDLANSISSSGQEYNTKKYIIINDELLISINYDTETKEYYMTLGYLTDEPWRAAYAYILCGNLCNTYASIIDASWTVTCGDVSLTPFGGLDGEEIIDTSEWCANALMSENFDEEEYDLMTTEFGEAVTDFIQSNEGVVNTISNEDIENSFERESEQLPDYQETDSYFSHSGSGDDVVSSVITENISYAHIVHSGGGHFSVKGHHSGGYDLLVNTTDPYDGKTLIYPDEEYTFEVTAEGEWEIDLYRLGMSSVDSFSGDADYVTPMFLRTSDVYEITTNGSGHFAIKGWTDNGYDLLVNTMDENYSGKVMFDSDEQYAFFEITASRDWEIKPVN